MRSRRPTSSGITLPITKQNYQVQDVTELADVVADAIAVALSGRPGPVLIDVPKDVQNQKIEYRAPRARARGQSRPLTPGASPGSLETEFARRRASSPAPTDPSSWSGTA